MSVLKSVLGAQGGRVDHPALGGWGAILVAGFARFGLEILVARIQFIFVMWII